MAPPKNDSEINGSMSAIARFLQTLLAERPERRRSPGVAGYLRKKGVGEQDPKDPRFILYRAEHFERAEALLRSAALPVTPQPKEAPSRKPRPRRAGRVPHAADQILSVAVYPVGSTSPRQALHVVMTAADAARVPHDVIVVCQEMSALQAARNAGWLEHYLGERRALLLFRGGIANTGYTVRAAHAVLDLSPAPVLGLVNMDSAGLVIASRLPRLEGLCVSWDSLERQAGEQLHVAPRRNSALDAATHADVKRAWALLRTLPAGRRLNAAPLEDEGSAQ